MKKIISVLLATSMIFGLLSFSASAAAPSDENYITFEEYLEKYGEENVIEGFERAEAEAMGYDQAEMAAYLQEEEGKSLYECLSEGKFLGFTVLGVSDVAPGDPSMLIRLDPDEKESHFAPIAEKPVSPPSVSAAIETPYGPHKVFHSGNMPDANALALAYEENAGSYFYKYSYSWNGDYSCETTVTFNGTELHCGSQGNNMYIFLNALSGSAHMEFGFMANPTGNERNKGLYAYYNLRRSNNEKEFNVEPLPKVKASSVDTANKTMILENKTITMKLGVTNNKAQAYTECNGSMLYYREFDVLGLVANTSAPLTFMQAMSCVNDLSTESDPKETDLKSKSYFKNVKFSNTLLYNLSGARPFTTAGPNTYFTFLCKHDCISYNFDDIANTQTVSIHYDQN